MFGFMPKNNDTEFEEMFRQHIALGVRCGTEIQELLRDVSTIEQKVRRIAELEHEGDRLVDAVRSMVDRVYITKFDKEDIVRLTNRLDDIIGRMRQVAERIDIYQPQSGCDAAVALGDLAATTVGLVEPLVASLNKARLGDIQQRVTEIKDKEQESDELLHRSLKELFRTESDVKALIEWKDIFERLEQVTDHCQHVAEIVASMARKQNT